MYQTGAETTDREVKARVEGVGYCLRILRGTAQQWRKLYYIV